MFGSIGGTELLLIMVIALLVFGPRKLPQLGRTIGKAMGEFRRASQDFRSSLEREIDQEHPVPPVKPPAQAPTARSLGSETTETDPTGPAGSETLPGAGAGKPADAPYRPPAQAGPGTEATGPVIDSKTGSETETQPEPEKPDETANAEKPRE